MYKSHTITCNPSSSPDKSSTILKECNPRIPVEECPLDLRKSEVVECSGFQSGISSDSSPLVNKITKISKDCNPRTPLKECLLKVRKHQLVKHFGNQRSFVQSNVTQTCTQTNGLFKISGYIGVGYVLQLVNPENNTTTYECTLCHERHNIISMHRHLVSRLHRYNYLKIHYPTVSREFQPYENVRELYNDVTVMLDKIAKAIETHHGRALPTIFSIKHYALHHEEVLAKLQSIVHPNELAGPPFPELDEIRKMFKLKIYLKNLN